MSVIDRDLGYEDVKKRFRTLKGGHVLVGVRADPGWGDFDGEVEPDAPSIVVIASVHEFGSRDGRTPERSFLRSTLEAEQANVVARFVDGIDRVLDGSASRRQVLGEIGAWFTARVQAKIVDGPFEPLKAATVRARERRSGGKPSNKPLIDTGRLRQSIDWQVVIP